MTSATAMFNSYRENHPLRSPDLSNKENDDELTLANFDDGVLNMTVAPAANIRVGEPPRAKGESQDTKHLWLITKDEVPYALELSPQFIKKFSKGRLTHTNLSGGQKAYIGGEMWFLNGSKLVINGGSSRYKPASLDDLQNIAQCFKDCGYNVAHMGFDIGTATFARSLRGEPEWL